jgi:hypothetical protein
MLRAKLLVIQKCKRKNSKWRQQNFLNIWEFSLVVRKLEHGMAGGRSNEN